MDTHNRLLPIAIFAACALLIVTPADAMQAGGGGDGGSSASRDDNDRQDAYDGYTNPKGGFWHNLFSGGSFADRNSPYSAAERLQSQDINGDGQVGRGESRTWNKMTSRQRTRALAQQRKDNAKASGNGRPNFDSGDH